MDASLKRKFHVCFVGVKNLPALTPNLEDQRVDMVLALSWNKQVGFSYYYVVFGQEKGVDMSIFPRKKWWVKLSSVWKTQFLQFFFACVCGRACVRLDIPGSSKCEKNVPSHPKNLPKGRRFTYLEDRNL